MSIEKTKIMIFVSTGRCGTVRLSQILQKNLNKNFTVLHQIGISRSANVIGNILYLLKLNSENIKKRIYKKVQSQNKSKFLINTDPLTSMLIPKEFIHSENVCIVHVFRDKSDFAKSFFKFSRLKRKSFIAHNFIPFWQINILPLQNWILGKKVIKRYEKTADIKNAWFVKQYQSNKYFESVNMKTIYNSDFITKKIHSFFEIDLKLSEEDLKIKTNTSVK